MDVAMFSLFSAVPPGGVGSPSTPDAFSNKFKYPILVRDIVIDWDWTIPTRSTIQTYGTPLGDAIRILVKYANQPMTAGYVPVRLLGQITDWEGSTPSFISSSAISGTTLHSTFRWVFRRPLWLPPDTPLTIQIQHQNDFAVDVPAASQDVDVTVRGTLDESGHVPDFIDVPYATAFLGRVLSTVSAGSTGVAPTVTERSAQTDLFNPFNETLMLERMKYEISVSSHGSDAGGAANTNFAPTDEVSAQDQTSQLANGQAYGLDRRYVVIKLTSSDGRNLIQNFTPIGGVLSTTQYRRGMANNTILEPGAYYLATLQSQMPLFVDRGTLPFQMRTAVGFNSFRRLTIPEIFKPYRGFAE